MYIKCISIKLEGGGGEGNNGRRGGGGWVGGRGKRRKRRTSSNNNWNPFILADLREEASTLATEYEADGRFLVGTIYQVNKSSIYRQKEKKKKKEEMSLWLEFLKWLCTQDVNLWPFTITTTRNT